ncbi:protein CHROMOSOME TRANSMISSION FIDELITY 7-like [Neltuma alba]|uniref:protein CHROMOSOME TRANSMISSION FIDELITY 7-like n=1 Tax=Neltuma alba TaxID=207710 RepID=UPI0010A4194F|nr:protein CHROMOSOME TRANSMISSION FIDELITY 7-like [Prosopis alba]
MTDIDLGNGWIIHEHCKVYLFTSPQRIVGCLVAEAIKEVSKVISCSSAGNSDGRLDTAHGGAIFCEDKAVTAVCGIRAIWMPSSNRRKRIARQLLDAVRKSFYMGFVLEHSQLAFSQLTTAGMALASGHTGS